MDEPAEGGRRIALFGGSFDPPHLGHIAIARAAQAALQLDRVLFAPVGIQPLKPMGASASYEDRIAMTELAIKDLPQFAISFADAPDPSGEPNYTIDTLHRLEAQFPSASLFLLLGADSLRSLSRWYRGAQIPFVAPLIVASRPGERLEDLAAMLPEGLTVEEGPAGAGADELPFRAYTVGNGTGDCAPIYLLPGLEIEISASDIRQQAHLAGTTLDALCTRHELLPEAVCAYIAEHGLYR